MCIVYNIIELVGSIFLVQLNYIFKIEGCLVKIVVKLEGMNFVVLVKDCIGVNMINVVECEGLIVLGKMILVELIFGNIGIVLVMVVAVRGYKLILIMLEIMSMECCVMLWVYGVELVLIFGSEGMRGVIIRV